MSKDFSDRLDDELMKSPAYAKELARTKPFEKIATELIRIRCEAGLTQKQLAHKIGTTASAISRIESLEYGRVTLTTLLKIADVLELDLDIQFLKRAS